MTKTIITVTDVVRAEEQENKLLVKVGKKVKKFELLSKEQCEELKEEAQKVGKAACFIKRYNKVYGSVVPKNTYVDEEKGHKCKDCRLICKYMSEDDNVWEYPFITNAIETVGAHVPLGQLIVINCSKFQKAAERRAKPFKKHSENVELMKELFDELHQSKNTARPKGKI